MFDENRENDMKNKESVVRLTQRRHKKEIEILGLKEQRYEILNLPHVNHCEYINQLIHPQ